MIARRIFIEGLVQGVFFREWTVKNAREIGISGWVRNRRDGRVEVYATGEPTILSGFIDRLHQGSPAAQVKRVEVEEAEVQKLESFVRRETV